MRHQRAERQPELLLERERVDTRFDSACRSQAASTPSSSPAHPAIGRATAARGRSGLAGTSAPSIRRTLASGLALSMRNAWAAASIAAKASVRTFRSRARPSTSCSTFGILSIAALMSASWASAPRSWSATAIISGCSAVKRAASWSRRWRRVSMCSCASTSRCSSVLVSSCESIVPWLWRAAL
jgi:hypothetical protein